MDLTRKIDLLRTCPLFAQLPNVDVEWLAAQTMLRHYRRGHVVYYEGDPGDCLILVAEGRLKVLARSEAGDELLLTVVGPPDSIGALAIADGGPRSETAEALTDATVLRVDRADILRLAVTGTTVADALTQMLAVVVRRLTSTATDLVFLDLPRRLAKLLLGQCRIAGADVVVLPWTQTDMASCIGASRQSVNSALRDFHRRGWITTEGPVLRVHDAGALERFAGSGQGMRDQQPSSEVSIRDAFRSVRSCGE
jgi:CRP/FNR family cyclic AMP-dependent transcriptional regulator